MLYKIIFFDNQVKHATSILQSVHIINEEIINKNIASFPVTKNIISNWTSRKIPIKSKKRYHWVTIEKIPKSVTFSSSIL